MKRLGETFGVTHVEEMDIFASKSHYNLIKRQLKPTIPVSKIYSRQKIHIHAYICVCIYMCRQINLCVIGEGVSPVGHSKGFPVRDKKPNEPSLDGRSLTYLGFY